MNTNYILVVAIIVALSTSLAFLLRGFLYLPDDEEQRRTVKRESLITASVFGAVGLVLLLGYLYYPTLLARLLLSEKRETRYATLCDRLFETAGKQVHAQYLKMRSEKSPKEIQTLCGNYAKQILKRK